MIFQSTNNCDTILCVLYLAPKETDKKRAVALVVNGLPSTTENIHLASSDTAGKHLPNTLFLWLVVPDASHI
jgi:hypothetical protein